MRMRGTEEMQPGRNWWLGSLNTQRPIGISPSLGFHVVGRIRSPAVCMCPRCVQNIVPTMCLLVQSPAEECTVCWDKDGITYFSIAGNLIFRNDRLHTFTRVSKRGRRNADKDTRVTRDSRFKPLSVCLHGRPTAFNGVSTSGIWQMLCFLNGLQWAMWGVNINEHANTLYSYF